MVRLTTAATGSELGELKRSFKAEVVGTDGTTAVEADQFGVEVTEKLKGFPPTAGSGFGCAGETVTGGCDLFPNGVLASAGMAIDLNGVVAGVEAAEPKNDASGCVGGLLSVDRKVGACCTGSSSCVGCSRNVGWRAREASTCAPTLSTGLRRAFMTGHLDCGGADNGVSGARAATMSRMRRSGDRSGRCR